MKVDLSAPKVWHSGTPDTTSGRKSAAVAQTKWSRFLQYNFYINYFALLYYFDGTASVHTADVQLKTNTVLHLPVINLKIWWRSIVATQITPTRVNENKWFNIPPCLYTSRCTVVKHSQSTVGNVVRLADIYSGNSVTVVKHGGVRSGVLAATKSS